MDNLLLGDPPGRLRLTMHYDSFVVPRRHLEVRRVEAEIVAVYARHPEIIFASVFFASVSRFKK